MSEKFTVMHRIVEDALLGIEFCRENSNYKPVLEGGIAIQLYAAPNFPHLLRPTTDSDILVIPRMGSTEFRETVKRLANFLFGYKPSISVRRHVYEVELEDEEGDKFFIHSYKWTEKGWENIKRHAERKASNANRLKIPYTSKEVYAVRTEDIIADKLDRLEKVEKKKSIPKEFRDEYKAVKERKWDVLTEKDMNGWLYALIRQKNALPSYYDRGEEEFVKALNEYRASKDLFDIALILKLTSERKTEFDERYYEMVINRGD